MLQSESGFPGNIKKILKSTEALGVKRFLAKISSLYNNSTVLFHLFLLHNCTYISLNIESFPRFFTLIFSCFEPTLAPDKQVQIFSNSVSLLPSYPYLEDFAYGMTAELCTKTIIF